MGRYYEAREYDCLDDYYGAGHLGTVSPNSIRVQRQHEAAERARARERTYQEMRNHQELYGD